MATVGSADIIVRAITTKVKSDIEKAFRDARPAIQAEGRAAGKAYAGAFGQTVHQELDKSLKGAVRNASKGAANEIDGELVPGARRAANEAGDAIENALAAAGRRAGRRAGRGAGAGFASVLAADLKGAISRFMSLASVLDLIGPAIGNVVSMLSGAISGLYAMAAAANNAAASLVVLPGILGVLLQSFGAIKLAFGGVGEAISAGAKAQDAAASASTAAASAGKAAGRSAAQAAAAAKRVQKAEDALRAAQEAAKRAQDALNKARDRASEGAEDQQDAEAALAAAIQKRNEILSDPNASGQDAAAAQKAVDDAKAAADAIADTRENAQKRLRRAEERNDAAQRKLAAAQAARDRASKDAQKSAAAGGISSPAIKAAQAYQDALSKLTPEAQAFVKQVLEMKEAFKEVGDAVAREMFPPLTRALELIGESKFFDILKKNLTDTGRITGRLGLDVAKAFTTKSNMTRFQDFLAGNNEILKVFRTRTEDGTRPMESLVNIILKLGNAIQPLTKEFAEWIAKMITAWDAAHEIEDLEGYFNRAGETAKQLGRIFGNLWDTIKLLSPEATAAGQGLMDSFEGATEDLEKFVSKLDKATKTEYFEGAADNLRTLGNLLKDASKELIELGDNEGPQKMEDGLSGAIEKFGDLGDKLTSGEVGESLGELSETVADLMESLTQQSQMKTFIDTFDLIAGAVDGAVDAFNRIPHSDKILAFLAVNRAADFSSKILGINDSFRAVRRTLLITPLTNFASKLGEITGITPRIKKLGETFKNSKIGQKMKSIFTKKDSTDAEKKAEEEGDSIGKHMAEGLAEGLRENAHLVRAAVDDVVDTITLTLNAGAELMDDLGKEISQGLAQGIRGQMAGVTDASSDLGQAVIDAIEAKLDISSPSRVMSNIGEDTGEGFVQGVRGEIDDARRAGADLADAAADGAKGETITARVQGAATGGGDGGAATNAAMIGTAMDNGDKKAKKLSGTMGKLGGATKKAGGAFKSLGGGLLGLAGGPIGLLLMAIPLIITAFTMLYKKSPEFKKFIDGIVNAVKPLIKAIGGWLLGVMDKLFKWVNTKLPGIKKWFMEVFQAIGDFIKKYFIPFWQDVLLPGIQKLWDIVSAAIPIVKKIFAGLFEALKFYITKIFIPLWQKIFELIKKLWPIVKKVFSTVWGIIKGVFNKIKDIWNNVLKPVFTKIWETVKDVFGKVQDIWEGFKKAFGKVGEVIDKVGGGIKKAFGKVRDAAKTPIKWVIDTVWNDGLVALANKIPGVNISGWKVDTSGWARGGWTGPGAKYDVAGIVHRDEFVVNKASRRAFESAYPGILDFINKYGRMPSGHAGGGRVPGFALGGWAKSAWKGTKSVVSGGIKWTRDKAKSLYDAIQDAASYLRGLPSKLASNLNNSEWGQKVIGFPKAAANAFVQFLNDKIPNSIPGISDDPFNKPFPGIDFRANGGRVRKGLPYVVGEMRPELFVPDQSGTILPNLKALQATSTMRSIFDSLDKLGGSDVLNQLSVNSNSGPRTLNVHVNNPRPERASQSVTKAVRSKAVSAGWGV